jgi:hypothetical protein
VKASSWSLENFWKSSSVGVLAVMGSSLIGPVLHPKGGGPAMNAICALHNQSQGRFVALQQNICTASKEAANRIKISKLFQSRTAVY